MAQTIEPTRSGICQRVERAHASLQPLQPTIDRMHLAKLQRLLLTTDGTVTDIVETNAGERVRVVSIEGVVLEVEPETGGARDHRDRRRGS